GTGPSRSSTRPGCPRSSQFLSSASPTDERGSKILGGLLRPRDRGRRTVVIALVSTILVFTALGFAIANSPGWPEVHRTFFNGHRFTSDFPGIADAFLLNVKMFLIAEAIILPLALLLAVLRNLPGPAFFPIRALAIAYVDFFRGIPTILLVLLL